MYWLELKASAKPLVIDTSMCTRECRQRIGAVLCCAVHQIKSTWIQPDWVRNRIGITQAHVCLCVVCRCQANKKNDLLKYKMRLLFFSLVCLPISHIVRHTQQRVISIDRHLHLMKCPFQVTCTPFQHSQNVSRDTCAFASFVYYNGFCCCFAFLFIALANINRIMKII